MFDYFCRSIYPPFFFFLHIQRIILINFRDVAPYDIALLKLEKPLKLGGAVQPINLPSIPSTPSGRATLTGWGSTSRTSTPLMPSKLQTAYLPLLDLAACKQAIEKLTGPSPLHETNVCTGPLTGDYSACSVSITSLRYLLDLWTNYYKLLITNWFRRAIPAAHWRTTRLEKLYSSESFPGESSRVEPSAHRPYTPRLPPSSPGLETSWQGTEYLNYW